MCGAELKALPEGVQRVAALLDSRGHPHAPVMLDGAARTAQQAADALGVALGQIAKSIVFRRPSDDACVVVVTSGDQRVDERKLEALVCASNVRLARADAGFVKSRTGFSIGGVAPLAHAQAAVVVMDSSLLRFEEVWAAAGHPNAVFKAAPQALLLLTGAPVADLAAAPAPAPEPASPQFAISSIARGQGNTSASGKNTASPCTGVCRITASTGWCAGCCRTLAEIAAWSELDNAGKRALLQTLRLRRATLPPAN